MPNLTLTASSDRSLLLLKKIDREMGRWGDGEMG